MTRVILSLLAALVLAVTSAGTAGAHAALRHAEPAAGEQLATAPTKITITFSTGVRLGEADVHLTNDAGVEIGLTRPDGEAAEGETLVRVIAAALAPGTYKVRWRVLSIDGHWTRGDYSFSVSAGGQ